MKDILRYFNENINEPLEDEDEEKNELVNDMMSIKQLISLMEDVISN